MIAQYPVWPTSRRQGRFILFHQLRDALTSPRRAQEREVERQMNAIEIAPVILHDLFDGQVDLTNEKAIIELINDPSHLRDHLLHLRTIRRIERNHCMVRWH